MSKLPKAVLISNPDAAKVKPFQIGKSVKPRDKPDAKKEETTANKPPVVLGFGR